MTTPNNTFLPGSTSVDIITGVHQEDERGCVAAAVVNQLEIMHRLRGRARDFSVNLLREKEKTLRGLKPEANGAANYRDTYKAAVNLGWCERYLPVALDEDAIKIQLFNGNPVCITYTKKKDGRILVCHAMTLVGYSRQGFVAINPQRKGRSSVKIENIEQAFVAIV